MSQNKYVSYQFISLDDFILYLMELIQIAYNCMRWHKTYLQELENMIQNEKEKVIMEIQSCHND